VAAETPLLDTILMPDDLRRLPERALRQVADELRAETIDAVSVTGGHLGAGLGVVELSVALHYVFDTPDDRLVWDVGHQTYPHKILTGRRGRIRTVRKGGGLSGFAKRSESEYDTFGAGHSSTSISAGLGMAVARDLTGSTRNVVCVIGDGAMSAGMAYEAMNNAGARDERLVVVLNDNDMSIAPPVGSMSAYLARLVSGGTYRNIREAAKHVAERLPRSIYDKAQRAEEFARGFWTGGTLFEELGFYYVGPVDGHNLDHLVPVLRNARDAPEGPILVHVVTHKGRGYAPAEASSDKYHGVASFDVETGAQLKGASTAPSYTRVFAEALIAEARADDKIVAITAAMPAGTGLDVFGSEFPRRTFDVGIAEQHAVTFAAGLAADGMKPFCAIYSTFLQRAFDQVFHDVAIMDLPVVFALDRGGIAGADGPTHHGIYDMAYLRIFPNMICMAPKDENELRHMLKTAFETGHPTSLRYPRGNGFGVKLDAEMQTLPIGKGEVMREGTDAAIFAIGNEVWPAVEAAETLAKEGISVAVINGRFIKPMDEELVLRFCKPGARIITVEEGSLAGGFGAAVMERATELGLTDVEFHRIGIPDEYVHHGAQDVLRAQYDLHAEGIARRVRTFLSNKVAEHPRFASRR
jgi:1-deoxy-D-xylulose-5-phosphate synthase